MATSNVIKIDSDYFICSCKSVDELAALKETEGIKSILYLTLDTEQDMGCTPNGFEGVKSVFTDCNSHVALAPSDFAFSVSELPLYFFVHFDFFYILTYTTHFITFIINNLTIYTCIVT
mgnify:FL=1|jgi:hypothetical protein